MLAFTVAQRQKEIGVRIALGAGAKSVRSLIVRRGMINVAGGLALGAVGSVAASRVLKSLLFEVSPADPATFVLVALILASTALAACYLPARRAIRVDPMRVLREE